MAASPHDYLTNVEDEINDPASFFPTALRHDGKNLLWIKPAYATYRGTPAMAETIESSFLCDLKSVQLPPNMERMSKQSTITTHQEEYIREYTLAAATLDHWYSHNQNHNKFTMEEAIKTWKLTCDKLTQNPFFSTGWYVPAFYPFYSYQCMVGLQDFLTTSRANQPKRNSFWESQSQLGHEMFNSWESLYHHVTAPNHVPFPKYLWYHKYTFIHKKKQPDKWKTFFTGSESFSKWGRIM